MKIIFAFILSFVSVVAFSQAPVQDSKQDTTTQVVIVKLTEWQEKQIMAFDQQRRTIDEQSKLLWSAIMDANKIDEKKITKAQYQPGEFVLRVRKK